MLHAEINGLSVGYNQTGTGPVFVLLYGFTHDSSWWGPQLESLSDVLTVIAWDASGAGQSVDPREKRSK
jgi:pimeloyl-ACP methyl ester carboxylesterase